MKKLSLSLLILAFVLTAISQNNKNEVSIIPTPVLYEAGNGSFTFTAGTKIKIPASKPEVKKLADSLSKKLSLAIGKQVAVMYEDTSSNITDVLHLRLINDSIIGPEGYKINVSPKDINISANTTAGLFYGVQTLYQLLPKEIEGKEGAENIKWVVPACNIVDYPRFGWRGLMFDVSRHFFNKEEVKQFIDDMVRYKFNVLHWHLTDDEGWRIEIKSLPKLTEIGAWRPRREGKWANTANPPLSEPNDYGGFYTHEDIKEVVEYAREKFVAVLPEIDVPGHSLATVAAYPELSCTPGKHPIYKGKPFMDWPGPVALTDNTLCPANEEVYLFLDKVFTEVAQLFPFEYIHMGGDECAKNFWEKSAAIKVLMQKEKLKDMHEVQSYFVGRAEKIVQSKGKKLMGWDEILEGGLTPGASVMSWRGMKGGIEAAKSNHSVVMSPTNFAYLDYMQSDPLVEPLVYASLRLNQSYKFDPVPPEVDPKFILGGQGNLWTEQLPNMRAVQYMVWPRGLALAESVWSPKEKKNWNNFVERVENHFERLDMAGIKYARSMYDAIITSSKAKANGNLTVTLGKEIADLDIHYSFDETHPDNFYPKYKEPLTVPKDAANLKVITYRHGKPAGKEIKISYAELEKRAGKN